MATNTDTSAEAVERIRKYIDYPHTSPETVVLDSDLVRITASDLRALLAERDQLQAQLEKAERALQIMANNPHNMRRAVDCHKLARATLDQIVAYRKARGEG